MKGWDCRRIANNDRNTHMQIIEYIIERLSTENIMVRWCIQEDWTYTFEKAALAILKEIRREWVCPKKECLDGVKENMVKLESIIAKIEQCIRKYGY